MTMNIEKPALRHNNNNNQGWVVDSRSYPCMQHLPFHPSYKSPAVYRMIGSSIMNELIRIESHPSTIVSRNHLPTDYPLHHYAYVN